MILNDIGTCFMSSNSLQSVDTAKSWAITSGGRPLVLK